MGPRTTYSHSVLITLCQSLISTFKARDNKRKKEIRSKGWSTWTPHTVNQLISVLCPNGTSTSIAPSQTHKSFWCFWARAFKSSSSCSCLATCKSRCTRRLRWTFVAKWCSTGNKHRQESPNQPAKFQSVMKQVRGRFLTRKDSSWQGNNRQDLKRWGNSELKLHDQLEIALFQYWQGCVRVCYQNKICLSRFTENAF